MELADDCPRFVLSPIALYPDIVGLVMSQGRGREEDMIMRIKLILRSCLRKDFQASLSPYMQFRTSLTWTSFEPANQCLHFGMEDKRSTTHSQSSSTSTTSETYLAVLILPKDHVLEPISSRDANKTRRSFL